jgi:hypothetical protein
MVARRGVLRRKALAASLLALCGAAAVVAQHYGRKPVWLDNPDAEQPAEPPAAVAAPSALLLYDGARVEAAAAGGSSAQLDCSLAWLSVLEEEAGATRCLDVRLAGAADLRKTTERGRPLVAVVTRSCGALAADLTTALFQLAEQGSLLILEQPDDSVLRPTRVGLSAQAFAPRRLTRVAPMLPYAPPGWADGMPVITTCQRPSACPPDDQALLWLDGGAAAWRLAWERGAVVVLACDLGRWLTALWQGVPQDDFSVHGTHNSHGPERGVEPDDLVADPTRVVAWVPRADLLARTVLASGFALAPTARLSPLPAGTAGLFVMTHDEDSFGDRSTFLSDLAASEGASSTFFAIPDRITVAGTSAMLQAGCDVQLQWNRGSWLHQVRRIGVGPWRPLAKELNLADQVQALQRRLPAGAPAVTMNRTHALLWDGHWTRTLRILQAQHFELDSSYGPAEGRFGYVFETGRPYHPLDVTGYPFALLELPFCFQDDKRYDPALQEQLLADSEAGYHCVLTPIFHTATMQRNPDAFRMRGLLQSFSAAAHHRHPVMSMSHYLAFRHARLQGRALLVEADAGRGRRRFQLHVVGEGQALELTPSAAGLGLLRAIELDGGTLPAPPAERWGWVQIPLPAGEHTIVAVYGGAGQP